MKQSVEVVFDGEVLRPQQSLDLQPNQRYRITIEEVSGQEERRAPRAIDRILARARDLGVTDLAEQHDHYLYGTPKS